MKAFKVLAYAEPLDKDAEAVFEVVARSEDEAARSRCVLPSSAC
jgi:hypothetical protein